MLLCYLKTIYKVFFTDYAAFHQKLAVNKKWVSTTYKIFPLQGFESERFIITLMQYTILLPFWSACSDYFSMELIAVGNKSRYVLFFSLRLYPLNQYFVRNHFYNVSLKMSSHPSRLSVKLDAFLNFNEEKI